jgi:hypothetical protein
MIGDISLDFVPKKMDKVDERDLFVKKNEKIDEDNYIYDLIKEDEDKILENIEKDDDVIRAVREQNSKDIYDYKMDVKKKNDNYLDLQKRKWMATVPTMLEYYNSGINVPSNKFLI